MIDDGRNDPPEVKIENHVGSLTHFQMWERELRPTPPPTRRKRFSDRFWGFVEALGNTYIHGGHW
jgi:hypothetical protein